MTLPNLWPLRTSCVLSVEGKPSTGKSIDDFLGKSPHSHSVESSSVKKVCSTVCRHSTSVSLFGDGGRLPTGLKF